MKQQYANATEYYLKSPNGEAELKRKMRTVLLELEVYDKYYTEAQNIFVAKTDRYAKYKDVMDMDNSCEVDLLFKFEIETNIALDIVNMYRTKIRELEKRKEYYIFVAKLIMDKITSE